MLSDLTHLVIDPSDNVRIVMEMQKAATGTEPTRVAFGRPSARNRYMDLGVGKPGVFPIRPTLAGSLEERGCRLGPRR